MADVSLVAVVDSPEDLLADLFGILFGEVLALADLIEEFTPLYELSNYIEVARVFIHINQFDNAGVVQALEDIPFVLSHGDDFLLPLVAGVLAAVRHLDLLHGPDNLSNFVLGFKHFSIGAFTNLVHEIVGFEELVVRMDHHEVLIIKVNVLSNAVLRALVKLTVWPFGTGVNY